jgi:hypothetical protein
MKYSDWLRSQIRVTAAPTVRSKELNEAATFAYVASRIGVNVSIDAVIAALPRTPGRPDLGFVPGFGTELKTFPELAAEFGLEAVHRPGLAPADAVRLVQAGNIVVYRTSYWCLQKAPRPNLQGVKLKWGSFADFDAFTTALISANPGQYQVYDPYLGLVSIPPACYEASGPYTYSQGIIAYQMSILLNQKPKFDAVIFSRRRVPLLPGIRAARLGAPTIEWDEKTKKSTLSVPVFMRAKGQFHLSARWVIDNEVTPLTTPIPMSFEFTDWKEVDGKLKLDITGMMDGRPRTVHLAFDNPDPNGPKRTGQITFASTGFVPKQHGWSFQNPSGTGFGAARGLCLGMSRLAGIRFMVGKSTLEPLDQVKDEMLDLQRTGAAWYSTAGQTRLALYGSGRFADSKALSGEFEKIRSRLQSAKPAVVIFSPSRNVLSLGTSHAVVATAYIECEDAFNEADPTNGLNARLLAIYDPNFPGELRYAYVLMEGSTSLSLGFLPGVSEYAGYKYLVAGTED